MDPIMQMHSAVEAWITESEFNTALESMRTAMESMLSTDGISTALVTLATMDKPTIHYDFVSNVINATDRYLTIVDLLDGAFNILIGMTPNKVSIMKEKRSQFNVFLSDVKTITRGDMGTSIVKSRKMTGDLDGFKKALEKAKWAIDKYNGLCHAIYGFDYSYEWNDHDHAEILRLARKCGADLMKATVEDGNKATSRLIKLIDDAMNDARPDMNALM